ncbi:MAG: 23S rRNA (guanosine(2251)-2'-O)-methyltransferase RlmB, partial [Bacteroidetes bacterium]|nr:23S rRNA (guanosine(2251)-2'-O)-methyltransferase RlmB [Bacteroidota bacterium]
MQNKRPSSKNLLYGRHPIMDAIEEGKPFDKIFYLRGNKSDYFKKLKQKTAELGIPIQGVPVEKLNGLTGGSHQGVVAWLSLIQYYKMEDVLTHIYNEGEVPLFVILDGIMDVRNLGAIARSADFCGAHSLIVASKGSAPINADAIKTSAGALNRMLVCRVDSISEALEYLKLNGIRIVASASREGDDLQHSDLTVPLAILLGSEDE